MAAIDPYAPCPCGSGQKFKWCCQGAEAYIDRAQRLFDGNQAEAAIQALDEGLRKLPDSPLILLRKAVFEMRKGRFEEAKPPLDAILAKDPAHLGAQALYLRILMETADSASVAARLQVALASIPEEMQGGLAPLIQVVGAMLAEEGRVPAAIEHLTLALELHPGDDSMVESALRMVLGNPAISPWLRNIYELSVPPDGLDDATRARFEAALDAARRGLWDDAGKRFETLAVDRVAGAAKNVGFCRLWSTKDAPAVSALRRYVSFIGETEEAVDLEALCQLTAPPRDEDSVEHVQLIWNLKSRDALLAALRADRSVFDEGTSPIDARDPNSPEVDTFALLDRPRPDDSALPASAADVPRIVGRALVGREIVALETFDDGRLDGMERRLVGLAGPSIPPAHPKTKVLGAVPRQALAMQSEWWTPEGSDPAALGALYAEERARLVREVWSATPMPYLKGRTPAQAAQAGDAKVALRAAVCQLELSHGADAETIDFPGLRARLGIEAEPEIDPETVEVSEVHLARLHRVPADRLDDDRLVSLFDRAHAAALPDALERAALALIERPEALARPNLGAFIVFADLAELAMARGDAPAAFDLLRRGRAADRDAARDAVRWDMLEIRLRARSEAPESWVPSLAVVLDRYRDDRQASSAILSNLVELGLVRMTPSPDRPEEVMMDTRGLQALLQRYGPRITTSSGRLGVSATQPGALWTPGQPQGGGGGGGGGGIWTPGSGAPAPAPGGEKSKLIIPGR